MNLEIKNTETNAKFRHTVTDIRTQEKIKINSQQFDTKK